MFHLFPHHSSHILLKQTQDMLSSVNISACISKHKKKLYRYNHKATITPEKLTVASSVSGQISACLIEVVEVYTLSRSLSLSSVGASPFPPSLVGVHLSRETSPHLLCGSQGCSLMKKGRMSIQLLACNYQVPKIISSCILGFIR